jgi:hypothetical protein
MAAATYHQRRDSELDRSLPPAFQQQLLINGAWEPQSGILLHNHQANTASSAMYAAGNESRPSIYPPQYNATTKVTGLLTHCNDGLTQTILLAEDITEIERVVDFLILVGSPQDAFKVAQALLLHVASTPPHYGHASAHLAQTAVTVVRNARVLYDCDQIVALLGVAVFPGAGLRSRDDKHWRLLLSSFGLVLQGSTGASSQHALKLCHVAAHDFGRIDDPEIFDWRYLILITNLKHASAVSRINYDFGSVWNAYYNPRRRNTAISNIDGYIERLLMWCTVALDDAGFWESFGAFTPDLWTNILDPANIDELEYKTLFCYLYKYLQSHSHITPLSRCHVLLQEALRGLHCYLNITTWEALSAILRMLTLSNSQRYPTDNRSNLARRALCRIQDARNLRPPLGILTATGWAGSSMSATFLETLAQNYCRPNSFSSLPITRRVDAQVRNFLDYHLVLNFSMNAFMHGPFAQVPSTSGAEGGPTAFLVDLIMYEKTTD